MQIHLFDGSYDVGLARVQEQDLVELLKFGTLGSLVTIEEIMDVVQLVEGLPEDAGQLMLDPYRRILVHKVVHNIQFELLSKILLCQALDCLLYFSKRRI